MSYLDKLTKWVEKNSDNPDHDLEVRNFNMNKALIFERGDEGKPWHICKLCDYPQANQHFNYEAMAEKNLCFSCDFWQSRLMLPGFIVKQHFYSDGGRKSKNSPFLGYGGSFWFIEDFSKGKLLITNNLWSGGRIPSHFYKGDNARFISTQSTPEDIAFVKTVYQGELTEEFIQHIEKLEKNNERESKLFPDEFV